MIGDDPSATVVITDNGSEVFRDNCFDSEVAEFTFARRPYSIAEEFSGRYPENSANLVGLLRYL